MIGLIGLITILVIVYCLVRGVAAPLVVLSLVPIVAALAAGFGPSEVAGFAQKGTLAVVPIATLFIFAILFFSVVRQAGIFEPLVRYLLRFAGDRVVRVTVATSLVAILAHLEGIGAATFLITIPTFLPVYRRLQLSPYDLLMITGVSAGAVNFAPWGGPVGRAALALHLQPVALWLPLIPTELTGAVAAVALAFYIGKRAERRLAGVPVHHDLSTEWTEQRDQLDAPQPNDGQRTGPVFYWFNVALTVGAVSALILTPFPPALIFLVSLAIALVVNFKTAQQQLFQIKRHAPEALTMGVLMLAAGSFLGVMDNSGMLTQLSQMLTNIIPATLGRYVHIIIGVFSLPLGILFSPDAFYLGLMPMVNGIAAAHGIQPMSVAHAMMLGESVSFSVSPAVPTAYLAVGLAGCDIGEYLRRSILWYWAVGLVMLASTIVFGTVQI